jgi:hypothetical protein
MSPSSNVTTTSAPISSGRTAPQSAPAQWLDVSVARTWPATGGPLIGDCAQRLIE